MKDTSDDNRASRSTSLQMVEQKSEKMTERTITVEKKSRDAGKEREKLRMQGGSRAERESQE